MRMMGLGLCVLLAACSKGPTAADVCKKLETDGIAKGCKQDKPQAISGRAKEKYAFDLPSVAGKTGQVLSFERDDDFQATEKAFREVGMLAGTHRYGNAKARIFVQLNSDASLEVGTKTKAIVDAL
jgi:hypothetical protein